MTRAGWRWAWLGGIAAVALALVTIALVREPGRAFDAHVWERRAQAHDHAAAEMAERLIASSALHGMTRGDVVRMLGTPPPTYFKEWALVYWLGPERGFISIDSEWLVVRFDAGQRVIDYRIVRD